MNAQQSPRTHARRETKQKAAPKGAAFWFLLWESGFIYISTTTQELLLKGSTLSGFALIQMTESHRQEAIGRHLFYLEQVQHRVLSALTDEAIELEAHTGSNKTWERRFMYSDPGSHAERTIEDGVARWELLRDLRNNLILSTASTLFHSWEKQTKDWFCGEIERWYRGDGLQGAIWRASFDELLNLLKSVGFDVRSQGFYDDLNLCRLIVGVHKHGDGVSLNELMKKRPDYLVRDIDGENICDMPELQPALRNHTRLYLNPADLEDFSNAILHFWRAIPEDFLDWDVERLPKWIRDALS